MEESTRKLREYIVNSKQHLKNKYWILICGKTFDTNEIHNKMIITSYKPSFKDYRGGEFGFLATICFEVDNRAGTQRRLWVLPVDVEIPDGFMADGLMPQSIIESASKMPKGVWN